MSGLSRTQQRLSKALLELGDDAMLIEELDGFFAGLIICPEIIPPSTWLPFVWDSEAGTTDPVFDSMEQANKIIGLVMGCYNDIARTLTDKPERYSALFLQDKRHNEVLWEFWIEGFNKAVKLRPSAWQCLMAADFETLKAWTGLTMLVDVAHEDPRFTPEQLDAITSTAHEKIADWVVTVCEWRLANHAPNFENTQSPFSSPASRIGRNDPCPCGSGKKYKKCCGLN